MISIATIRRLCIGSGLYANNALPASGGRLCLGATYLFVWLSLILLLTVPAGLQAQNVIGGTTGDPSAVLELQSSNAGLLLPRLTLAERNAIVSPAEGLLIYNTTLACIELNTGSSGSPDWVCLAGAGKIASLNCAGASLTGTLRVGESASNVSLQLPYTGGNGYQYKGLSVASVGITGLTATLLPGVFPAGNGSLSLVITGTPSGVGTASFALLVGGQSCTVDVAVNLQAGVISTLFCADATAKTFSRGSVKRINTVIPYAGGNGGVLASQTTASTGVTGLTATLALDTLMTGDGSLTLSITGAPSGTGSASFALSIGGQSCSLVMSVIGCTANVAASTPKAVGCHNLGANPEADPQVPSWELIGDYYQWGRNPTCFATDGTTRANPCSSPIYGVSGPWGSGEDEKNMNAITGWSTTAAPNGSWANASKTENDPCPEGFRIPTASQWSSLINNTLNPRTVVGTWTLNSTNYSSGLKLGASFFLPVGGYRATTNGSLDNRGRNGYYWASTESSANARHLFFAQTIFSVETSARNFGFSLRCIEE